MLHRLTVRLLNFGGFLDLIIQAFDAIYFSLWNGTPMHSRRR